MSDVMELLKRQEDLEAMIQVQSDRFIALQKKKTQVCWVTNPITTVKKSSEIQELSELVSVCVH